ncbi:hypothetical protein MMB17_11900 [Methylobacterium organophilum]|uniref:hypothetical protein n=1 Tax=Methylobacterium organophilum TaxID=410 RepID=UPI001F12ED94|nr:hypothetical protein [Methylobacterium organophilum]UMY19933.1 hypothetical protein MMB17_11900 [Methylobacterium organophilum]
MDVQNMLRNAITAELKRQAEIDGEALSVGAVEPGFLTGDRPIDLDALIMVITGAVAGGS